MAYLDKRQNTWKGQVRFNKKTLSKRFTIKSKAEKWECDTRQELWQPYIRKALEMYARGEHRKEIEEIFKEDFDIDLTGCLVPTYKNRFKFSVGNPWREPITKLQTEASFTEIGKDFGFSRQRAEQDVKRSVEKFNSRYRRMFGFENYCEMGEDAKFKQLIPAHYYLEL